MRTILVISTKEFGENICAIRKRLGWSAEYFCQYFDIEPWMLERIEMGDYRSGYDIYVDSFWKILKFTGIEDKKLIFDSFYE